jgi:hypothetical protein
MLKCNEINKTEHESALKDFRIKSIQGGHVINKGVVRVGGLQ